ncbi:MAG: hypothetical protein AB2L07_05980 [Thermoanaerobaculaceae bacterium]
MAGGRRGGVPPGRGGPFVPAAAFDEAMRLRAAYRASKAGK